MAKFVRRPPSKSKPLPPTDAAAGASHVRKFMLKLFDREDGQAADWPLIAETLLREAFYAIDQVPAGDAQILKLLRRTMDGSTNRLTGGPADKDQPVIAGRAPAVEPPAPRPAPYSHPDPFSP